MAATMNIQNTKNMGALSSQEYTPFPRERADFYEQMGCWGNENHIQFLYRLKNEYGRKIAIIQGDYSLSYEALYARAELCAQQLASAGIKSGDFVVLQSANVSEFFVVLFGLYFIGARPVFCLNGHGAAEVEGIARNSGAVGYIKINSLKETEDAQDICNQFSQPNFSLWFRATIVSDAGHNTATFPGSWTLSTVGIDLRDGQLQASAENSRSLAFLQLSGGTTGTPKLIPRTHADYLYSVDLSAKVARLDAYTKILIVLPVMHNFTMSSPGFLGAFSVGATVVLAADPTPGHCFSLIEQHAINQVSLVPSLAGLWAHSPLIGAYDLSSLQVMQVGGAKLQPELAAEIYARLGVKLQQVYGMAEGLVNFTSLDDDRDICINTQGKPLSPYDEILIVDEQGAPVTQGVVGLITTRGPYTINGYYHAPEVNAHSFTADGFYITGDLGFKDEFGNITVTGRQKELINRAGEKITPSEVEALILSHPQVRDVTVIGVPDKLLGERIKALIILHEMEAVITRKDIVDHLHKRGIAQFKIPDDIDFVNDFKYTHVGKVNRRQLVSA